ncbi:hypothetical protein CCR75_001436 [Bremia lactucae]|uniref:Uncharacterized protein n=1 Tax=Bremia lactucae TaxID=4779 RepID=A0A976IM22_BRELC|nr:hypothetical protein CCR75_001436 [Bremia lactucae]
MTEQTESERDAIVAWLEQNDNFLRATAFSGPPGMSRHLSDGDRHQSEQIETQALNDLAASVNKVLPQSRWDSKLAKQMLHRYLILFKATATQASEPGFTLSKTDIVFGIKTVEDKLNSMCPHFIRLQMLCGMNSRMAGRKATLLDKSQETLEEKDSAKLNLIRTIKRDKTVRGTDSPTRQKDSFRSINRTLRGGQTNKKSAKDKTSRHDISLRSSTAKLREKTHQLGSKKKSARKKAMLAQNSDILKAPSTMSSKPLESIQQQQTEKADTFLEVIELLSDDEESPLVSAKETNVDNRTRPRSLKAADNVDDESRKRKVRRVDKGSGGAKDFGENNKPSQVPDRFIKIPVRMATSRNNQSKQIEAATPAMEHSTTASSNILIATRAGSLTTTEMLLNKKSNEPVHPVQAIMENDDCQNPIKELNEAQPLSLSRIVDSNSDIHSSDVQPFSKVAYNSVQAMQNVPAQPRSRAPDALRSAIAQVVSQRQELLRKQRNGLQYRQTDSGETENDPSGHTEDIVEARSVNKLGQRNASASDKMNFSQRPSETARRAANGNVQPGSRVGSRVEQSEAEAMLETGLIPPLLSNTSTFTNDTNVERKRLFLRAKQLAFEQFRWIREKELQQDEVELLRREMKSREIFARKEIELRRMSIQADVIALMILSGATVEQIAERLKLLSRNRQVECAAQNL